MTEYHYSDCDCGGWESMCEDCQDQLAAMEERIEDLERFVKAWDRCDSSRGLYSCDPLHDCRCLKDRKIGECTCGADELLALREKIGVIE